ncbi:MAG: ATP-binding protein [Byssovorax sp.]
MERISVSVEKDYLQRVAAGRPLPALAELIWNGLDEDATQVHVEFQCSLLGAVEAVRVIDDGNGIPRTHASNAFGKLGGSWKQHADRTPRRKRSLHGKVGKGRFLAFALGDRVKWTTRYEQEDHQILQYSISGDTADWGAFTIDDSTKCLDLTGTEVTVSGISRPLESLTTDQARQQLTEQFALYLHDFNDVRITYNGERIDPEAAQNHYRSYELPPIDVGGVSHFATLIIIEWKMSVERTMHLCDNRGFSLLQVPPSIQAKGYNFTVYLKSEYFAQLHETNALSLESLHPELRKFLDQARDKLRDHFRQRTLERASQVLDDWKKQDLYPFDGPPASPIELAERDVFDICALQIHDFAPGFQAAEQKAKKLSFHLLRLAIEQNPGDIRAIFSEILRLPKDRQDDLRDLVDLSQLAGMISAAKKVADRLLFLELLETILFNPETRRSFRERPNLHKLVEGNTWLFGEEFHLTGSDSGLTQVLRKHEGLMGRKPSKKPVLTPDGGRGIVDIALGRKVSTSRSKEQDYLIVELKRPKVPITMKVYSQIMKYGRAIATDERFNLPTAKWTFWAVSNALDSEIEALASQPEKPRGLLSVDPTLRISYYALPWRQIIDDCKQRLTLFKDDLAISIAQPGVLDRLRALHGKYLPPGTDVAVDELKRS